MNKYSILQVKYLCSDDNVHVMIEVIVNSHFQWKIVSSKFTITRIEPI